MYSQIPIWNTFIDYTANRGLVFAMEPSQELKPKDPCTKFVGGKCEDNGHSMSGEQDIGNHALSY